MASCHLKGNLHSPQSSKDYPLCLTILVQIHSLRHLSRHVIMNCVCAEGCLCQALLALSDHSVDL